MIEASINTMNIHGLPISLILIAVIIIVTIIGYIFKFNLRLRFLSHFSGRNNQSDDESDSEILSFYTAGHLIVPLARTTAEGMKFGIFMTLPYNLESSYVTEDAGIMVLNLPFNTQTHIIGLTKQHGIDRIKFDSFVLSNGMEKVDLEGDFSDYFDIYVTKGQQFRARMVLDPDSMQFVVDFCKTHFWEINNSELYLAVSSADQGTDNYIKTAFDFAKSIQPALLPGEPGAAKVHHQVPYGEYDGSPLKCPVCSKTMTIHDNWQICPDGHGVLINGKDLTRLHTKELKIVPPPNNNQQHGKLQCPFCRHAMEQVNYEDAKIIIDSCTFCTFRWLDADEVTAIMTQKVPSDAPIS